MADALLSALASTILTNLNSLALGEFATIRGFRSELHNLESTFTTIQSVLVDAEKKQWMNEAIRNWLRKLEDVAYEADDLLDEFAIQAQRRRLPKSIKSRVRSFFSDQNPAVFELKMAHKLKSVREKLDAVASERQKFLLREEVIADREFGALDWRQTTSFINESETLGRDKEKEELISKLLASSESLSIHAICGMGGVGKTTLAQLVYNDRRVGNHFDLRIWVCMSDNFNLKRLSRAIIESIEGSTPNVQELDPLQRRVQEKLSGRKFLLVLDDVWNEPRDKWDGLNNTIQCGATGSVVILTTRNENIAHMIVTTPICHIGRLSDGDSWTLFEQRAFGLGSKEDLVHLEIIGREIVRKCGGIPLGIKAMGSLMRLKRKEREWLSVKESEIWELPNEGSMNIFPALRLSYDHLAPHVKQCFAFCSIFPKDYVLNKDKLIGLWMANGFIPVQGQLDLYNRGQETFDELVWRSFFQDVKEDFLGEITCKMHDLVHDLARSVTISECKSIEPHKVLDVPKMVRHLSICETFQQSIPHSNNRLKDQSLRSFIGFNCSEWDKQTCSYFSRQKQLRVLVLHDFFLDKLPMPVDKLKHLRYLEISWSFIKILPESTINLQNLQTLNLRFCHFLCRLPKGLKHMTNLTNIDITECWSINYMPPEMGRLTRLRNLSTFIVGKDNDSGIGQLKELNLGGNLIIKNLDYVASCGDAKIANLMQKKDLKSLSLQWSGEQSSKTSEEVLDGLQPHSSLKKLKIIEYPGSSLPNWMMDLMLPNLVEIILIDCTRCEHLPSYGRLKFLKNLSLVGMNGLKCIGNDVYGNEETSFPSLRSLRLEDMEVLEAWEMMGGREPFPVLEKLVVENCSKLRELPIIPSVKTLEILGGSEMLMTSLQNFTSITELSIGEYKEITYLPDGLLRNHTRLERLQISGMTNLKSLGNQLDNLSALKRLNLENCEELESLSGGLWSLNSLEKLDIFKCKIKSFPPMDRLHGLSSLRALWIQQCEQFEFISEGLKHLTSLKDLLINGSPKLTSLPESIGCLTALERVRIWNLKGLSSLPNQIGNLVSLSCLEIRDCPDLLCLPEGIRNLKRLRELRIEYCPDLKRRCQEQDYPNIAHIPFTSFKDR